MTVKSGQSLAGSFVTRDSVGALSTATVGPVGYLYVNGVVNAATVTITGSNPYKFAVTLPTLAAGDKVDIYITATVDTVATGALVFSDMADTKRVSDLNDIAAGAAMALTSAYDAAKNAASASAVGAIPTNPLLTDDTRLDDIAAIKEKTDTIGDTPITVITPIGLDGSITILRGDTFNESVLTTTMSGTPEKLWFGVKSNKNLSDSGSIFLVQDSAVKYIDGITPEAGDSASITYVDSTHVAITISAATSAKLPYGSFYYDIQYLLSGKIKTVRSGTLNVSVDVVRATS